MWVFLFLCNKVLFIIVGTYSVAGLLSAERTGTGTCRGGGATAGRIPRLGSKAWKKTDELDYPSLENAAHHSSTTQVWKAARVPAPCPDPDPELSGAALHTVV